MDLRGPMARVDLEEALELRIVLTPTELRGE
jgi:hypothetical protein